MRGGYRPGSGRKKGFAVKGAEEARRLFSEAVMREISPIAEALIARAKKGDVAAARELFDRAWGKPRQAADMTVRSDIAVVHLDATVAQKNRVSGSDPSLSQETTF